MVDVNVEGREGDATYLNWSYEIQNSMCVLDVTCAMTAGIPTRLRICGRKFCWSFLLT
jgi:hypothetical protein